MMVYLFCKDIQKELLQSLAFHSDNEVFKTTPVVDHEENTAILVILSQFTQEQEQEWAQIPWYSIYIHRGIRGSGALETAKYFSSMVTLNQQVNQDIDTINNEMKRAYLSQLQPFDSVEYHFMEELTGEEVPFPEGTMKKQKNKHSIKALISLRGYPEKSKQCMLSLAKYSKRTLLIDADTLCPSFENLFGFRHIHTTYPSHINGIDNTGLNILLDCVQKEGDVYAVLAQCVKHYRHNIDILLGNYNMLNYEYYDDTVFTKFLTYSSRYYDLVMVQVSDFPYDAFALRCLQHADLNLMLTSASKYAIRARYQQIKCWYEKQKIPMEKMAVIATESARDDIFRAMFGKQYAGSLSGSRWKSDHIVVSKIRRKL